MRRFRRYAYLNCNASLHYYGLILGISTCAIFVCGTMSRLKVLSIQDQATFVWHSKCGSELSIAPLDAWVHTLVLEILSKGITLLKFCLPSLTTKPFQMVLPLFIERIHSWCRGGEGMGWAGSIFSFKH